MSTIQKFEDLKVWQQARQLSQKIYKLTFAAPLSQDFRLKDQMRGSSGSVMDNIAEGFERESKLEFINALTVAKRGVGALKSQLYRALDNNYFPESIFDELYGQANELTKMLTSFIGYLNKTTFKGQKFKDRQ